MLTTIWLMAQFLVFALAQVMGAYPQADLPGAMLLAVVGILAVTAFTPFAVRAVVRLLGLVPAAPLRPADADAVLLPARPCAPGTRGTVRTRAPAPGLRVSI